MISHEFFEQFDKEPPISCPTCHNKIPMSHVAVLQYYKRGCRTKEEKDLYLKALKGENPADPNDPHEEHGNSCCVDIMWNYKRLF